MDKADISIIVTAFNVADYIEECLDSIQNQNHSKIEIICVDDASTDETENVIMRHAQIDKRIVYFRNEKNRGAAYSRNIGIRAAKGKYIMLVDGDDCLCDNALALLFDISENNNLDLLSFSGRSFVDKSFVAYVNDRFLVNAYERMGQYTGVYTGTDLFIEYIKNHDPYGNLCLQFIRRNLFSTNHLYANEDLRYCDDSPFAIYLASQRAMCINVVLYNRRYRFNSAVTGKRTFVKLESIFLSMLEDLKVWNRSQLTEEQNRYISQYFRNLYRSVMYMYYALDDDEKKTDFSVLKHYPVAQFMMRYFALGESRYDELDVNVIQNLKKNKARIYIYGAGLVAADVAGLLEHNGIIDYSVIVTKKDSENQTFHGRNVFSFDEIKMEHKDDVIIVAMSKKYHDSVRPIIRQAGMTNVIWVI